jgi:hypothetical protein
MSSASSSDMGIVTASACGTSRLIRPTMSGPATPLATRSSAYSSSGGIMKIKVKTSRPSRNGISTCRITYRSMIDIRPVEG